MNRHAKQEIKNGYLGRNKLPKNAPCNGIILNQNKPLTNVKQSKNRYSKVGILDIYITFAAYNFRYKTLLIK